MRANIVLCLITYAFARILLVLDKLVGGILNLLVSLGPLTSTAYLMVRIILPVKTENRVMSYMNFEKVI